MTTPLHHTRGTHNSHVRRGEQDEGEIYHSYEKSPVDELMSKREHVGEGYPRHLHTYFWVRTNVKSRVERQRVGDVVRYPSTSFGPKVAAELPELAMVYPPYIVT